MLMDSIHHAETDAGPVLDRTCIVILEKAFLCFLTLIRSLNKNKYNKDQRAEAPPTSANDG